MKFTKEEISLCKLVAEKYRKEIKYGDWYLTITTNPLDKDDKEESVYFNTEKRTINPVEEMKKDRVFYNEYIPLWTISDCLEFLRERGWKQGDMHFNENLKGGKTATIYTEVGDDKGMFVKDMLKEGKTPLEACLKAVLAML